MSKKQNAINYCKNFFDIKNPTPDDVDLYIINLKYLASLKDLDALTTLGDMYFHGDFVEQDFKMSAKYFQKGANEGSIPSTLRLGDICYYGFANDRPDYKKAYECYSKIAMVPSFYQAEAIYKVADMFIAGNFVKQDKPYAKALLLPTLFQENQQASNFEHNVLADVVLRLTRTFVPGEQDYFYRLLKYYNLAKVLLEERKEKGQSVIGDHFLIEECVSCLKMIKELGAENKYFSSNINKPALSNLDGLSLMLNYWECKAYINSVKETEDGVLLNYYCFNEYVSLPEISYYGRVKEMKILLKSASIEYGNEDYHEITEMDIRPDENKIHFFDNEEEKFVIDISKKTKPVIVMLSFLTEDGKVNKIIKDDFDLEEFEDNNVMYS